MNRRLEISHIGKISECKYVAHIGIVDKDADFCVVEILYKDGIIFSQIDKNVEDIKEYCDVVIGNANKSKIVFFILFIIIVNIFPIL